jgi:DNA-binding NtrC family response regulator
LRDTLDCVVLMTPDHSAWVREWVDSHRGQFGRLQLYSKDYSNLGLFTQDPSLSTSSLALRRFDGCILPVSPVSLSWTRTMLANVDVDAGIPVIALLFDISAPAILDLLSLGVTDFVRAPVCPEELRARVLSHLPRESRQRGAPPTAIRPLRPKPLLLEEQLSAAEIDLSDIRSTDEPFREAKARVVEGFERAYLRRALLRYSGNVAQAARASSKHRRAFWALMRKHQIDASTYRCQSETFDSSD